MSITITNQPSVIDAAREYAHEGLRVIALKPGTKLPLAPYKEAPRVTEDEVEKAFAAEGCGVAVALGAESQGLCDVDCDWTEAALIAGELLGSASFGRPESPDSHFLFACEEAAAKPDDCRIVKFELPNVFGADETRLPKEHGLCVLELRANGQLTTLPPTMGRTWIHEKGCRVPSIQPRSWDDLRALLGPIAFLAVAVRFYPRKGARANFCRHLAGAMLRSLSQREAYKDEGLLTKEVERCVKLVATLAQDEEAHTRAKDVPSILDRIKKHEPVSGFPKLVEAMGAPKAIANTLRGWLNPDGDPVPTITYRSADIPELLDRTEQLLLDNEIPIYQREKDVVQIVILGKDDEVKGRKRGAQVILPLKPLRMREHIIGLAHWKAVSSKGKPYPCAPPVEFAAHYLARVGNWKLPVLDSVCKHPTLRADDSLIVADGYDDRSHILIDSCGIDFGIIKDNPTEDEAREALALLKGILDEFPFEPDDPEIPVGTPEALKADSASRSVALSGILTAVSRRTMNSAPLHIWDAPDPSAGKTVGANVPSNIATGLDAPPITFTGDSDEERKVLYSLLRHGDAAILYDNVDLPFESASLCTAVTEPTWGCRLLGVNEIPTVRTNTLISATGNNIRLRGDMVSRSIKARLNPGMEYPSDRKFKRDLVQYVRDHRPELVRAALTILRWNISAGYPALQEMGGSRFRDWNRRVRSALVALSEPDPLATQKTIRESDSVKTTLGALLAAIKDCDGIGEPFVAGNVIAKAKQNPALDDAVNAALADRKAVTAQGLGYYLDRNVDTIAGGMRLRKSYNTHANSNRYRVEQAGPMAPEPGQGSLFE